MRKNNNWAARQYSNDIFCSVLLSNHLYGLFLLMFALLYICHGVFGTSCVLCAGRMWYDKNISHWLNQNGRHDYRLDTSLLETDWLPTLGTQTQKKFHSSQAETGYKTVKWQTVKDASLRNRVCMSFFKYKSGTLSRFPTLIYRLYIPQRWSPVWSCLGSRLPLFR